MQMTREKFETYEKEFNDAADKNAFFDRWYDPQAVFVHPLKGTFTGKEQLVSFWVSMRRRPQGAVCRRRRPAVVHTGCRIPSVLSVSIALTRVRPR